MEAQVKKRIEIIKEKRGYWQGHIASWRQSGLSQAEYCRRQSLSIKNFGYWKRKQSKTQPGELKFFPLVLSSPVQGQGASLLRLTLQEKRFTIEIKEDFSPVVLKKLILSLEEMQC